MPTFGRHKLVILIALALRASVHTGHAVIVDWSTLTWTPGTLNNSFDVDPGSPGNDVTVAVTGDTSRFIPSASPPNPQTPAITQSFQGGFGSIPFTLELRVDYQNTSEAVTVTVNFSVLYVLGVNNVSFTIFDIDSGTYQDEIRSITALSTDGVTQVAPTITGLGSAVSLTGTGSNQVLDGTAVVANTGAGSGDGNATISFNSPITSFTFTYGSGPSAPVDPTSQKIGIFNIDFIAVVPEINPAVLSSCLCLLAVGLFHIKDRCRRRM